MTVAVVRAARPDDAPVVAALEEECLGADAWSPTLVTAGVGGDVPTVEYLVAEVAGEVRGYAATSVVAEIAELQRIAVSPSSRRAGLARALVEAVVGRARTAGADRLLLEVREDNSGALAFYADRGFVEIDRRRRYYHDGGTAVVMRLPLRTGCGGG